MQADCKRICTAFCLFVAVDCAIGSPAFRCAMDESGQLFRKFALCFDAQLQRKCIPAQRSLVLQTKISAQVTPAKRSLLACHGLMASDTIFLKISVFLKTSLFTM
jgi:hypothetical protein